MRLLPKLEHVGSTAVPGLIAKPVIDMDVVLASPSNLSNVELRRHLAFRDALRADRALRDTYSELKKSAALQYSHDRKAYTEAKSEFIRTIVGAAYAFLKTFRNTCRVSRRDLAGRNRPLSHIYVD